MISIAAARAAPLAVLQRAAAACAQTIVGLGKKARDGALSIDEMAGGTFTISNGGVYGSLLSTPILNPPQSAILGMHSILPRPMVVDGAVVPRPMMYIALTYDHRLIDGREVRVATLEAADPASAYLSNPAVSRQSCRSITPPPRRAMGAWVCMCAVEPAARCKGPSAVCSQAVTFLRRIKDVIEDPRRLLLGV